MGKLSKAEIDAQVKRRLQSGERGPFAILQMLETGKEMVVACSFSKPMNMDEFLQLGPEGRLEAIDSATDPEEKARLTRLLLTN